MVAIKKSFVFLFLIFTGLSSYSRNSEMVLNVIPSSITIPSQSRTATIQKLNHEKKSNHSKVNLVDLPAPTPIPLVPEPERPGTMPMGDPAGFQEVKMDFPMAVGPFLPTWESINQNYSDYPSWLREAKFGIWVHFGPQASGMSGDWYARRMYVDVVLNSLKKFKTISARVEVNVVMLDAFPETFNPDIVDSPAFPIHRDFDVLFLEILGPKGTGILRSLVAVDDFRNTVFADCLIQDIFAPLGIHRVANPPG
jgi:hypothetical protein